VGYKVLTSAILVTHFAFLAYVVFGGFLTWRWPRTVFAHLFAAGWGLYVITAQMVCPLTYAENWSRLQAGEAGLSKGFIDQYIEGVLYPERYTGLMQGLAVTTVVASYVGLVVITAGRRRRRQASPR
jgi:hypothetical protein